MRQRAAISEKKLSAYLAVVSGVPPNTQEKSVIRDEFDLASYQNQGRIRAERTDLPVKPLRKRDVICVKPRNELPAGEPDGSL